MKTTRFFPGNGRPAVYTRGNGQGSLVWDADRPDRYTWDAVFSTLLGFEIVANLRRHLISRDELRWHYRYWRPRATADELELLVDAEIRAGFPNEPLTLDEAKAMLAKPLPPASVTFLRSA